MKFKIDIKDLILNKAYSIQRRSWIITIIIFLVVLVFAIVVWNDCILNPKVSETTLKNILATEKEYQSRMETIKRNHNERSEQIYRFNNLQDNLEKDKNYFEPLPKQEQPEVDQNSDSENYNPDLVD